jgi:hypothetical protein
VARRTATFGPARHQVDLETGRRPGAQAALTAFKQLCLSSMVRVLRTCVRILVDTTDSAVIWLTSLPSTKRSSIPRSRC